MSLAFDRWRVNDLKRELDAIGCYVPLEPHGQGYKDMSPAVDIVERLVVQGKLRHGAHPVLQWCAANAVTRLIWRDRELGAWKAIPATTLAPVRRQLGDPAFWVMTSGTTGRPKAVEHCHSNVGICAQYYERVLSCTRMDRLLGESEIGLAEIVLYIVPAPGADGSAAVAAARERLSQALPPYKRPRRFEMAHDLPRTATGKVQRNKLREQLRRDQH
jgi:acyl-coenzyme A synthetase/AMP-(fatty) acid ligase